MKIMYRAKVTRVTATGVFVEVPHVGTKYEFGPCEVPTDVTLAVDDRVVVGKIEEVDEDFVIVAKIGNTGSGVITYPDISSLVAGAGESSTTKVVRADDPRLSDARTPLSHSHAEYAPVAHTHSEYTKRITTHTDNATKRVLNLAFGTLGNSPGWLVIQTNLSANNVMSDVRVRGYALLDGQPDVDFEVGWYHDNTGVFTGVGASNKGTFPVVSARLMKRASDSKIAIVLTCSNAGSRWAFAKIAVDGVFWNATDAELSGWTLGNQDSISELAVSPDVSVPFHDLNSAVRRIIWNGTAYPARPTGARCIEWVGPSTPPEMTTNDTWVNTSL